MRPDTRNFAQELLAGASASRIALHTPSADITRAELGALVEQRVDEIGLDERSVVMLGGAASIEWVVSYLALLEAGHVPLLAGDHAERLADHWSPAATIRTGSDGVDIERRGDSRRGPELHPDLALLLSTSGSTGNPKLVRLSHHNVASNAHAIAEYLQLGPDDCGITTLPLHYCYGLSVVHSHLVAGARIVLTDASVVDPCFRAAVQRHDVTNISGVPYTFDLLEQVGADTIHTPSLRFMTQAGGRLNAAALARWRERTTRWGTDFIVMYGQTEATARMAYLPPTLAERHPDAIGIPVPGGSLRLAPLEDATDPDVGELVYDGPNVMLGYATEERDLALGRCVDELHTGDVARFHADDGVYEIIGRQARFIKPYGLRIDLDALEQELRSNLGCEAVAVGGDDDGLVVCAPDATECSGICSVLERRTGLPSSKILVENTTAIPRTTNGKIDYPTLTAAARRACPTTAPDESPGADSAASATAAAAVYASVLGRRDVGPDDTFVSLGGDSLSYIECSIRLERVLGRLPDDWHLRPIGELAPSGSGRWFARTDTTVALRALGICLVVATHMHIGFVPGGAHLLLAVVGYNLSRFIIPIEPTRARVIAGLRTAARIAVPTVLWVATGLLLGASYGLGTLLLVNNYIGPRSHGADHWHFWFIEVFVHVVVALSLLLAVPSIRRTERAWPYAVPLVLLGILLTLRMEWAQMGDWYNLRFRTHGVAWFVVLGWLIHRSDTLVKRVATGAICIVAIGGFFEYAPRERLITVCLLTLLVVREIPVPRVLVRPLATLASASMWIYISHFTIWPPLADVLDDRVAYAATILLGVAVWSIAERITSTAGRLWDRNPVAAFPSIVRIP